jgi:hypothetical protein
LQKIVNYPYIVGDCLFDSISYLLHGIVSSITLRKGFVECLQQALVTNDYKVEHYLKFAHSHDFLMSLHGVNFVENYLYRMKCKPSNDGLWADFTIFFWLFEFIKCPIEAWSTRKCKPYMNVGDESNTNEKLILAYHEGMNNQFELVKRIKIQNSFLNNNISNI